MTKYNFQINPKDPDESKIRQHKDFGRVMQQYQKMTHPLYRTPLYRYRKVFLSLLLVLLCAWLVVEYGDDKNESKNQQEKQPQDSVMTSPQGDSVKP